MFALDLVSLSSAAAASSAECRNLERQLTAASSPAASQARSYDKAIRQQQQQIDKVRAQRNDLGCGFMSFRSECGGIRATLSKMERNLAELERTRASFGAGGAKREQARILAALREKGCRGNDRVASIGGERKRSLFERIFGNQDQQPIADPDSIPNGMGSGAAWSGGSFRTLCVRTCDGYFFPISYSSSRSDFERDGKACAAMCPDTDVALYYHRVPNQESDQMISVASNQPYADLPAAFDYKRDGFARPAGCACGVAKENSILEDQPEVSDAGRGVAVPAARPDMAEDPESAANRVGGLDAAALRSLTAPQASVANEAVASIAADEDRPIRVVGPTFLPDPEGAIDLRAPARKEIR